MSATAGSANSHTNHISNNHVTKPNFSLDNYSIQSSLNQYSGVRVRVRANLTQKTLTKSTI
ncbi:hypothetical protein BpHYR1_034710 [Brachionus plicatilis]|uniref:Uncharacterized protein n=1 Tax=Brachionus plicatilis TaxID=10195 RepID=A0A3M7QKC5_BRAPC|nr:hypothetical protein BpHYR1_034710 [Brachionus plicatilis]